MRKGLIVALILAAAVAATAGAYYRYGRTAEEIKVSTLPIDRGGIAETVGATGTLEAVNTVQVGTQVSGNIKALHADFNSIVHKGQVVAELDPSLFQTQIEQSRANLIRSQAEVERFRVTLADAQTKLDRARNLAARGLIPGIELETAEVQQRATEAQLKSAQAQVVQAQASLNQSAVNLQHTVIEAPIDGIVISRNVDVGQTVAASMQAPTLFVIAADLTKMQVVADIDESDVGRIRPKQRVTFRVDAYPNDEFSGTVTQIRLQPKVVQNVVTYATVIDVPNPELKLKPGMTATVSIEIARKAEVLRVPNAALRFRASPDMFTALNLPVPPELQSGTGGARPGGSGAPGTGDSRQRPAAAPTGAGTPARTARGQTAPPGPAAAGAGASTAGSGNAPPPVAPVDSGNPPADPALGRASNQRPVDQAGSPGRTGAGTLPERDRAAGADGGTGRPGGEGSGVGGRQGPVDPEERRRRMRERMEGLSPEERARFIARMKERGIDVEAFLAGAPAPPRSRVPSEGGERRAAGARLARPGAAPSADRSIAGSSAQTIDSLFGPLPQTESRGRVWIHVNGQLKPVRLRLGITDGTHTEVLSGELQPGMEVVTGVILPAQASSGQAGRSPLMGPTRGPGSGRPPGR
jgi:HlyD family secretion protein